MAAMQGNARGAWLACWLCISLLGAVLPAESMYDLDGFGGEAPAAACIAWSQRTHMCWQSGGRRDALLLRATPSLQCWAASPWWSGSLLKTMQKVRGRRPAWPAVPAA